MYLADIPLNPVEFARFATTNDDAWIALSLLNIRIMHMEHGEGFFYGTGYIPPHGKTYALASFPQKPSQQVLPIEFTTGKVLALLPPTGETLRRLLAEEEEERRSRVAKQEEELRQQVARQEFIQLKLKYNVASFTNDSPLSELYRILMQIDEKSELSRQDELWLQNNNLDNVIATHRYRLYKNTHNGWDLVQACAHLRKCNKAKMAIQITNSFPIADPKIRSAVLTSRGGALRDESRLREAEACGQQAVQLTPDSFYPHSLLGAICYQQGHPEQGDRHFKRATELGAKDQINEAEIRSAFKRAGTKEKLTVARYLWQKDPIKYAWAGAHLRPDRK